MYFPLPACPFEFAGAVARVGISKHLNLLQLAAIPPVEFQDAVRPGGGGGRFTRPIPGDGGADQLRGVPVIELLPTDGTRSPEVIGNGRIWPDANGPV